MRTTSILVMSKSTSSGMAEAHGAAGARLNGGLLSLRELGAWVESSTAGVRQMLLALLAAPLSSEGRYLVWRLTTVPEHDRPVVRAELEECDDWHRCDLARHVRNYLDALLSRDECRKALDSYRASLAPLGETQPLPVAGEVAT